MPHSTDFVKQTPLTPPTTTPQWKINTLFTLYFRFLGTFLQEFVRYSHRIVCCCLYISAYHFSKIFTTSFSIIWKRKIFNKFTQTPTPRILMGPKSTKCGRSFSLMLPILYLEKTPINLGLKLKYLVILICVKGWELVFITKGGVATSERNPPSCPFLF